MSSHVLNRKSSLLLVQNECLCNVSAPFIEFATPFARYVYECKYKYKSLHFICAVRSGSYSSLSYCAELQFTSAAQIFQESGKEEFEAPEG